MEGQACGAGAYLTLKYPPSIAILQLVSAYTQIQAHATKQVELSCVYGVLRINGLVYVAATAVAELTPDLFTLFSFPHGNNRRSH